MSTTSNRKRDEGLRTGELARHFKVSEDTIRRLARRKRIPHRKFGKDYRFDLSEVKKALLISAE